MLTTLGDSGIFADKTGATPPTVIALHGWMRTGADFAGIVDGYDALAVHFAGMGITPAPDEAWGSEQYADALAEAIRPYGPVVFVAHSFGGRVVVHLAAKYPELVRGIVLTGVPLVRLTAAPKPRLGFRIVRSLAKAGIVSKSVLEKQRQKNGSADYRASSGIIREIFVRVVNETYTDQLGRITAPVRMVWGEKDTSAPADAGLAASELIPNATFRVVPGAGHLMDGDLRTAVREELQLITAEVTK